MNTFDEGGYAESHGYARRPRGGTWSAVNYFSAPRASNAPRVLFTTLGSLGAA